MKRKLIGATALVAAVLLGGGHSANAVPSYAFANLLITDFDLANLIDPSTGLVLPGVTLTSFGSLASDSADYPGSSVSNTSAPGTPTVGPSVAQATAGPGPFPSSCPTVGTGCYLPSPFQTDVGSGTRSDAAIKGPITNASSSDVTEGNLTVGGASASSVSGTTTTISATFSGVTNLGLTFDASVEEHAQVGQVGDSASAQTNASYRVYDDTTGTFADITGTENGLSLGTSTTAAPGDLNGNVASTLPGVGQNVTPVVNLFDFTATLNPSDTYQLTLLSGSQERLSTEAVPEPASIAVIGAGLLGLAAVRRRRKI